MAFLGKRGKYCSTDTNYILSFVFYLCITFRLILMLQIEVDTRPCDLIEKFIIFTSVGNPENVRYSVSCKSTQFCFNYLFYYVNMLQSSF